MDKTTVSAILLAAGSSSRMGENKMLMRFCGKTPVELCVEAFCGIADEAVIAVSPDTAAALLPCPLRTPFVSAIPEKRLTEAGFLRHKLRKASAEIFF